MKVSIILITYNHEKFIKTCLNSIFSQKIDFTWELIIAEDFSSDKTRNEIDDFLKSKNNVNVIKLYKEQNIGLTKNYYDACNRANGKYIATISGDDYWIDNTKLQKQVDFLENNADYVICSTHFKSLDNKTNILSDVPLPKKNTFTHQDVVLENPVIAGTAIFKSKLLTLIPNEAKKLKIEDLPMWWYFSRIGKIKYLSIVTLAYRQHDNNFYTSKDWAWMRAVTLSTKSKLNELTSSISGLEFIEQDWYKFIHVLTSNLSMIQKKEILLIFLKNRTKFNYFLKIAFNLLPNKLFILYFKIVYRLMNVKKNRI